MALLKYPDRLTGIRRGILAAFVVVELALFSNSLAMTVRPGLTSLVIWLLQSLPLLVFLPGIHAGHVRTHAWLCFVILMYFIHGVMLAFTPERMWIGMVEALATSVLFCLLILFIRSANAARTDPS